MNEDKKIQITKRKAKKLVEAWEAHIVEELEPKECSIKKVRCPIHKLFMDWKKDLEPVSEAKK